MTTRIFFALIIMLTLTVGTNAQSAVKTIHLEQTEGVFTIQNLKVAPGDYKFEIANNGINHEVGFVLAPKGKTDAANHIKEAYVTTPVKNGSTSSSQVVTLVKGEYQYFCPLNPTPLYTLVVE